MPFIIEESGVPEVTSTEVFYLNVLINVLESPSSALARRFRAKCYVDDVEKPIKSATWSVQDSQPAGQLEIQLANLADRTAFTRTAEIRLEVEEYLAGVWTLVKTYCDGSILATSNYVLENDGETPADKFSVTVLPLLQQRLDTTTDQIVVLYDPAKTTVDEEQLELVPNIDGTVGTATVTPIADMNLGDVFAYVATAMGFAGYRTNINYEPWVLSRVDFPAGQPLWQTVAGIIGNHEPKLSVSSDNYLVIRDGTLTDYISARVMTLSHFKSFNLTKTIERFKGTKLDQQQRADAWDYYQFRQEVETEYFDHTAGAYPQTVRTTWYQDFYRNSFPNVPVSSQVFSTKELEYEDALTLVSAKQENFSYNFGHGGIRPIRTTTREWGWANVPAAWVAQQITLPGPNADFSAGYFDTGLENSFTSTNSTGHSEAFVLTRTSKIIYNYKPFYGATDTVIAGNSGTETRGLITRDTENQQLGQDFDQEYLRAQETGNLAEGQDTYWGTTDYHVESQRSNKRRNVNIRTRGRTPLNSTGGIVHTNYRDRRIGDIGESEIQTETKPIYVTAGADATASLWRTLNSGEAPLIVTHPLCLRLNARQYLSSGCQGALPTYDATMDIGVVIDPRTENRSTTAGIFRVTGYTDTISGLEDGGFSTTITNAEQIAEGTTPTEIILFPTEADLLELQLDKSGSAVVIERDITCFDGYEISLGSVSGLTVELKHDTDVSYTNIETTPYDVSAYAGTDQTFQFRFTPSSTTGVFSFRFTYQPA